MWRSNSSVSSRTNCPPDIVNEEDHVVEEKEIPDFRRWNIPKVNVKTIYDTTWSESAKLSQYRVRTVEQTFSISRHHEKCCLFSKKNINEFLATKLKYLHIGLVQVAVKPLTRRGINASVLMCLRDARFKKFNDSILVKASPFKIADADTPVSGIIEECNFANKSLHIIGQQIDRIEEKIVEQTVSTKPEKPLIDLLSHREKIAFKTSQTKTLDIVEKILSD
ncbi:hypothetical protein SO802_017609 [Lithocarpus litseifolius]|uniref:Uncharacterized protein n=1 Tax=Lithocarpus litseifolius TaxID=425828 RepID=A0AAW2CK33_9ROSI